VNFGWKMLMQSKKVFIIDETEIVKTLSHSLKKEGFDTRSFSTGEEALMYFDLGKPDLVLLGLMLPGMNGLDVCRKIKSSSKSWDIPVVILTERSHELDVLNGFDAGADDYVTKPYNENILLARIKAAIRRTERNGKDDNLIKVKGLEINKEIHEVKINGKNIFLTVSEFQALHYLASNINRVFSRYQIVEAIKGNNYDVNDRSIDVLLGRLRKKLGIYGRYIETIYGVGYRFNENVE